LVKVVLVSPGDVAAERSLVRYVIDELRNWPFPNPVDIRLATWETDAYPSFHLEGPPEVIDRVLGIKDADLVIGLFWRRLGTMGLGGRTGTEHELGVAYDAWKLHQKPQIMVYFKQEPFMPRTIEETEQISGVIEFKKRFFESKEGLWGEYTTVTEFERLLRQHLLNYLSDVGPLHQNSRNLASKPEQKWFVSLDETYERAYDRRDSVMAELRHHAGDRTLTLSELTRGSMNLVLEGTRLGFNQFRDLFNRKNCTSLDGIDIKDVRELDLSSPELFLPLDSAETYLLQVLLHDLTLRSEGDGVHLSLTYDRTSLAIWSREAKDALTAALKKLSGNEEKQKDYQERLDAVLFGGVERLAIIDPDFPFRYANGGVLPVVKIGGDRFYCLFYRERQPIGWNIANGASDSSDELLHPEEIIDREFREELVMVNRDLGERYVVPGPGGLLDRPEHLKALKLWQSAFTKDPKWSGKDVTSFPVKEVQGPQWLRGPDLVTVRSGDAPRPIGDVYLTITTEDSAIELDRIVEFELPSGTQLLDGEIKNGYLLNRPVGLFNVDKFRERHDPHDHRVVEFVPDMLLHSGEPLARFPNASVEPWSERDRKVRREAIIDLLKENVLPTVQSKKIRQNWQKEPNKLNLCPVTRSIIRRHLSGGNRQRTD